MKYISVSLLTALFASAALFFPVASAEESEAPTMTDEEKAAAKEEAKALKAVKKQLTARKRIAFKKKYKSLKAALSAAKKANVVCYAIYSDPTTCPVCIEFEEKILNSSELKKLKGVAVCYISRSPIEEHGLTMKPSGAVLDAEGKLLRHLHYSRGVSAAQYAEILTSSCPKLELPEAEPESED